MWLGSSVVRVLARYARDPGFESRSGYVLFFSSPVTFGGSVWVRARAASSKGTVSSVLAWFRADSEANLIKQGEIVTGRPCGSVAQWSESRTVCERSWVRVLAGPCAFSSPVTFGGQCGSAFGLRAAKGLSHQFRHGSEQIRGRI